jgi:phenylalanyl-tRNA synthetase beta chain
LKNIEPPFYYKEVSPKQISFVPLGMDKKLNLSQTIVKHPKGRMYAYLVFKSPKYPVITDSKNQVLSFPPIINGELTRVKETTRDMFIDITGTDDVVINQSLNILVTALAERGGKIEKVKLNKDTKPDLNSQSILVDGKNIKNILGIEFKNDDIKELLERMNYGVIDLGRKFEVLIPPYRTDILHEVDIIEDIAISYGYNDFIPEIPKIPTIGEPDSLQEFSNTIRHLMIGLGFQEVLNYTLTSKQRSFQMMNTTETPVAELKNPISRDYSTCRSWLLPNLIENLVSNKHRRYPQKIFEISDCVVLDNKSDTKTRNTRKLAGVVSHSKANLSEIISIINSVKENLGLEWALKNHEHGTFVPGRCGKVLIKGKEIGFFGEIHPKVLKNWQLEKPVAGFEINIEEIL